MDLSASNHVQGRGPDSQLKVSLQVFWRDYVSRTGAYEAQQKHPLLNLAWPVAQCYPCGLAPPAAAALYAAPAVSHALNRGNDQGVLVSMHLAAVLCFCLCLARIWHHQEIPAAA